MIDMYDVPDVRQSVFEFSGASTDWRVWHKPRGVNEITIIAIAGGGGGGGGFTAAAASARGGGGGGGAAMVVTIVIPAFLLPDTLYIQVGAGGAGGAASANGVVGNRTYVGVKPGTTIADLLVSVQGGNFGAAGTGAAGGAGGGVATAMSNADASFSALGIFLSSVGLGGGAGGVQTGAVGTSVTALQRVFVSGGAGGGGTPVANTDFAGGDITGAGSILPTIAGGVAAAGPGKPGIFIEQPFISTGGSGGGTAGTAGTAGAGGIGAIGSGGGGGGGGVTGGAGGKGGDGYVAILCK